MKKVLVSGASGFVMSNALEYMLKNTTWEFTCLCSWKHRGSPLNLQFAAGDPRVTIISHDLSAPIPNLGKFDFIIHAASESHVDRSIANPVNFIENNVSITLQMLEYAREYPAQVFLNFSTDEVYGASEHKEWDVLLPANPYASSKGCQELIAQSYWRTYRIPVVLTNSNNIVGPNQDPEKFVPKLIKLIKAGKEVEIHMDKGKPGRRYYNPVQNVADALLFILNKVPQSYVREVVPYKQVDRPDRYSLPGGEELDNLEMAQLIAKILRKPLRYKAVNAENVRPGYDQFYPKTDGRLTDLGFIPPYTLKDGLKWIK